MPDTLTPDDLGDDADTIDFGQLGANTELVIPDGDYQIENSASVGWGTLTVRAKEGASPTLHPPDGYNEFCITFGGDEFHFEGIDIDVSKGVTGMRCRAPSFEIADFEFIGRGTSDDDETVGCFSINATDGGEGVVRNVTAAKGSTWARYKNGNGRIFAWVGEPNTGTIRFEGCRVEEFGNNGIYASESPGPVIVEDCEFWNNNVAGVRFGADGCEVRNTTIGVDADRYTGPREPEFEEDDFYHRGVWVETKKDGSTSPGRVTVVDSRVDIRDTPVPGSAIQVRPNAGGVRVQGSDIHSTETAALHGKRPGTVGNSRITHHPPDPPHDIRVTDSKLVADGGADAVDVTGRDVDIRDCCVQGADDRRGVRCRDAEGSVTRGRIIAGTPTEGVRAQGITTTGSCDDWSPRGGNADTPEIDPGAGIDPIDNGTDDQRPDTTTSETILGTMPEHTITLSAADDNGLKYTLKATESSDIEYTDDSKESGDSLNGKTASGRVTHEYSDTIKVTGRLETVRFEGNADVKLNGESIPATELKERTWGSELDALDQTMGELRDSFGGGAGN